MLTGGTGDQNLREEITSEDDFEQNIARVRSLLVFSVENQGARIDRRAGMRKCDVMMERWKAIFSKYDFEGSGTLTLKNIVQMIRRDLKISERLVSNAQIASLFAIIDSDGGGTVDFHEFLEFVQQPSTRGTVSDQAVVNSVARGVRLALMRNKIRVKDLETNFYSFDESGEIATGELGANDMIRFFRKVLKLSKHECSDKALRTAFHAMDDDGSGKMSLEELMEFIRFCSIEGATKEATQRITGLIGGMAGALPARVPSRRPGMLPGSPRSTLPFCLNGRGVPSSGRLSQTTQNFFTLSQSQSDGSLPSLTARSGSGRSPFEKGFLVDTDDEDGDPDSPKSPTKSIGRSPEKAPKRTWSGKLPGKTHGGYMLLRGSHALNEVEERLFAAGIDVRGHYHKLGRGARM